MNINTSYRKDSSVSSASWRNYPTTGVEIHIFIGNHDIWMFDYLTKEIGAVIHRDVLTIDLLGKRFFLGHGDEVDYRSRAFRFLRTLFRNRFCQWLYAGIHPRWTFGFALGWSLSSRKSGLKKHKTREAAEYQGEDHEYMVLFAKEYLKTHPDINFFIFGTAISCSTCAFAVLQRLLLRVTGCNTSPISSGTGKPCIWSSSRRSNLPSETERTQSGTGAIFYGKGAIFRRTGIKPAETSQYYFFQQTTNVSSG